MMINKQLIAITSGEPAGIGPDICLDLATCNYNQSHCLVVIGDIHLLRERARLLQKSVELVAVNQLDLKLLQAAASNRLYVWHIPCPQPNCLGQPQVANANYVLALLEQAIQWCRQGLTKLMVTAPLNKDIINQAGIPFSGHTEYLAWQFGIDKVVMLLANRKLRVALLTTHLPLSQVPAQVTSANLNQTLTIIHQALLHNFGIKSPKIAVCGLNPHAGENGYLGLEEQQIINPLIGEWQAAGYQVSGSYPADTIFNRAHEFDVILAMYHDQGLPVLKYADFASGVNVTLGLPILRTSVDHGTALDLAGSGRACSQSLIAAIELACTQRLIC